MHLRRLFNSSDQDGRRTLRIKGVGLALQLGPGPC